MHLWWNSQLLATLQPLPSLIIETLLIDDKTSPPFDLRHCRPKRRHWPCCHKKTRTRSSHQCLLVWNIFFLSWKGPFSFCSARGHKANDAAGATISTLLRRTRESAGNPCRTASQISSLSCATYIKNVKEQTRGKEMEVIKIMQDTQVQELACVKLNRWRQTGTKQCFGKLNTLKDSSHWFSAKKLLEGAHCFFFLTTCSTRTRRPDPLENSICTRNSPKMFGNYNDKDPNLIPSLCISFIFLYENQDTVVIESSLPCFVTILSCDFWWLRNVWPSTGINSTIWVSQHAGILIKLKTGGRFTSWKK